MLVCFDSSFMMKHIGEDCLPSGRGKLVSCTSEA